MMEREKSANIWLERKDCVNLHKTYDYEVCGLHQTDRD